MTTDFKENSDPLNSGPEQLKPLTKKESIFFACLMVGFVLSIIFCWMAAYQLKGAPTFPAMAIPAPICSIKNLINVFINIVGGIILVVVFFFGLVSLFVAKRPMPLIVGFLIFAQAGVASYIEVYSFNKNTKEAVRLSAVATLGALPVIYFDKSQTAFVYR